MHINLKGKKALVTGSTSGIGYAIASGLANAGADVTINGRSQASVDSALEKLRQTAQGATLDGVAADASTAEGAARLEAACPNIDILINNLGAYESKPFFELDDRDWEQLFQTNVMSGVRLARSYLPQMMTRQWGRIIFISSESALHIPTEMIHYGMTKTAQLAVSRGLAEVAAGTGVTVNAVLPGPTRTENLTSLLSEAARNAQQTVEALETGFISNMRPTSVIQRFATTEEVANLVVYTASEQASATTGAALRVDGGIVRAIP